jgi:hypothetical protein
MTDTQTPEKIIEISPIHETVSGHTSKLQVNLDEDSPDREIIRSLHEACKELSANFITGIELQRLVGRILIAVRTRELHKSPEYGTLDAFLSKEIVERFHISRRQCQACITIAEGIPDGVPAERLQAAGAVNVFNIARVVRDAPPQNRTRLRESLLKKASGMTNADFAAELKGRHLLRTKQTERGPRRVMLHFEVSVETAALWKSIVGERSASVVFSEWVRANRKPVRAAGSTRLALRALREQSA